MEKDKYNGALFGNQAVANMLAKTSNLAEAMTLLKEEFSLVTTGKLHWTTKETVAVMNRLRGKIYCAEDIRISGPMWLTKEVDQGHLMKVPGIPLNIPQKTGWKREVTKTSQGLWQISRSMEEWANKKLDQLLELREELNGEPLPAQYVNGVYNHDVEWTRDDVGIYRTCVELSTEARIDTFVIVSADNAMMQQICNTLSCYVLKISPVELAFMLTERETKLLDSELLLRVSDIENRNTKIRKHISARTRVHDYLILDTGACKAALSFLGRIDTPFSTKFYKKRLILSTHRECTEYWMEIKQLFNFVLFRSNLSKRQLRSEREHYNQFLYSFNQLSIQHEARVEANDDTFSL
jgi:hypothetical protein